MFMLSFSQRMGLKPVRTLIQRESADEELRNDLWNLLTTFYFSRMQTYMVSLSPPDRNLATILWTKYLGQRLDEIDRHPLTIIFKIKDVFLKKAWNEMFDILEFVPLNYQEEERNGGYNNVVNSTFMKAANSTLKKHVSAYRFIDKVIVEITSDNEIVAIETALQLTTSIKPVYLHLRRSLELLSDRTNPDYRNSIKESISAIESLAKLISGNENDSLGASLNKIKRKLMIHKALEQAFKNLYGYTSDDAGIRHALTEEANCDFEDAMFMLVSCSAFINYLLAKARRADINIEQ